MHLYDAQFFSVADETARQSAEELVPRLLACLPIRSVLDLGCGRGMWLNRWMAHGVTDIAGVDGPYAANDTLHIPPDAFLGCDLADPLRLGRHYDLVQCLEVAEHLPADAALQLVDNLCLHGTLILFSAAVPGQGGEQHVNEQPWEYWRTKFNHRGYEIFDYLRPLLYDNHKVFFWYRHNTFIYAHHSIIDQLPKEIRDCHVPAGLPLANHIPMAMKLMIAAIRLLPPSIVTALSRFKQRFLLAARRFANV